VSTTFDLFQTKIQNIASLSISGHKQSTAGC